MNNIENLIVDKLQKDPKIEIFSIENEGKKFWVKRARKTGSNGLHHFVYMLTRIPMLIPAENKNAFNALKYESTKLKELYDLSINVPKVVVVSKEYFVLEDSGPTIYHLLRTNFFDDPQEVCTQIITQLAFLHNLGKYHGGDHK